MTPDPPLENKIFLKRPALAAILSFLLPGAGQLYQGRTFKGVVNCVCVLTLMFWGLSMGEWGVVFRLEPIPLNERDVARFQQGFRDGHRPVRAPLEPDRESTKTHLGFLAQAPIGLISIPALIQEERYFSRRNIAAINEEAPLNKAAIGELHFRGDNGERVVRKLEGILDVAPHHGEFGREMRGTFTGTDAEGKRVEISVRGLSVIGPPIGAERFQPVSSFATHLDGAPLDDAQFLASLERGWIDRVLVPPNFDSLERLHGKLGKKFPLAEVFTWIAGLLNILVIWDAYAGPAYGYRMPRPEELKEETDVKEEEPPGKPPASPSSSEPSSAESSKPRPQTA
jgi:TM2 domain-containing membrane protein YozV